MKLSRILLSIGLVCASVMTAQAAGMSPRPLPQSGVTSQALSYYHCTFLVNGYPRETTLNQKYSNRYEAESAIRTLYGHEQVSQVNCNPIPDLG